MLQILIEERRSSHHSRHNEGREKCTLRVGDVAKAYIQVQSRTENGVVGKSNYRARGKFIITKDLNNNSFEVQRYGEPSAAFRKYKHTELYLLPPARMSMPFKAARRITTCTLSRDTTEAYVECAGTFLFR